MTSNNVGWAISTLNDVCEKITDGAHNSPKSVEVGKPMASVKDLTRFGVDLSEARLISNDDFEKLVNQGCMPEVGDVLIAKDGNSALDTVCSICEPLDAVLLSSVAILRPNKEKLDSGFLKYYFSSKKTIEYLKNNFISGAAIPRVVLKDFKKAKIELPPIDVQKKISKSLGRIDRKIELNHQINQTLEQMAQALFKSWFVDFDPVKAKISAKDAWINLQGEIPATDSPVYADYAQSLCTAAMSVISGKTTAQLETFATQNPEQYQSLKATADLFPDAMQGNELGGIPVGWELKPLYETAEYINGAAFKATDFSDNKKGLPIIKIAELKQGISQGTKFTLGEVKPKYFIDSGDVLYSWSGSPETSLEVFKWHGGEGWLNQHIFKLNFNSTEQKHFAYFLLKQIKPLLIRTAQQKQTTGLGHVTVADMKRIKIVYPNNTVLEEFSQKICPLYEKSSNLIKEVNTLTQLRDTLLPKLLSGELNVTD